MAVDKQRAKILYNPSTIIPGNFRLPGMMVLYLLHGSARD
jgi:hypothetical protein